MKKKKKKSRQGYHVSGISGNLEMSGNLAEVSEKSGKRSKVGERSGNLCSQESLIVAAQQNAGNQTVNRSSYNSYVYFIRTVIHFYPFFLD